MLSLARLPEQLHFWLHPLELSPCESYLALIKCQNWRKKYLQLAIKGRWSVVISSVILFCQLLAVLCLEGSMLGSLINQLPLSFTLSGSSTRLPILFVGDILMIIYFININNMIYLISGVIVFTTCTIYWRLILLLKKLINLCSFNFCLFQFYMLTRLLYQINCHRKYKGKGSMFWMANVQL